MRVPVVIQHDAMQCGIAALAIVAAHYGKRYSLTEMERINNHPDYGSGDGGGIHNVSQCFLDVNISVYLCIHPIYTKVIAPMRFTILLTLLALLTAACDRRHPVDDTLDRAETLMVSAPDSALSLLEAVNPAELRGDRRKALHALLLSQAMDKNYIDTDNDSLVNIAVNFYASDYDLRHRMLAYYYLGRVKYNAKDYPATMLAYFKAFDMAKEQNDNYWAGLSAREISQTYSETANSDEEIYYAKIAYEHMRLTGLHSHICSSLNRLTQALFDNGNNSDCLKYSLEMLDSVETYGLKKFEYNAIRIIGKVYIATKRYDEAIQYFEAACCSDKAVYNDSCYLGLSYLFAGHDIKAIKIFDSIKPDTDIPGVWLWHEVALRRNDYKAAHDALTKLNSHFDKRFDDLMHSGFSRLLIEHINTEKRIAQHSYNKALATKWILIIVFFAVIALIVAIAIRHNRKQRKTIEANNAIAEELRQILSIKESQNAQARKAIDILLSSRYETIDHLCRLYYQQKDNASLKARISDEVTATIKSLTDRKGKLPELEKNADKFHDGLMSLFRLEMPGLKEPDYLLVMFSILGFSITAITMLLNEDKIETIYNRKARLKSKIKKLNPPHAADFINVLS